MVSRDGFEVPLIGIPAESALDTCDLCGNWFPLRELEWTGKQNLCVKCRKDKNLERESGKGGKDSASPGNLRS